MRRALQRCSASLPRSLTTSSFNARSSRWLSQPSVAVKALAQPASHPRLFHAASRLRQEAAAQAEPAEAEQEGEISRFEDLGRRGIIHENVVENLTGKMGLETMTEVQRRTINEALKGEDIIAQAKTGTGKTLAFLLPILQNIISKDPYLARPSHGRRGPRTTADDIRALIVSPTRELAEQIAEEAKKIIRGTGLIVQTAVGGTQKSLGLRNIQRDGCHILVGTPGRLSTLR